MELTGLIVVPEKLEEAEAAFAEIEADLDKQIEALAGHPFNINSTKQLGTVLFEELKLPIASHTKTGWSTSNDALEPLRKGVSLGDFTTQPAGARLIEEPANLWPRDPPIRYRAKIPTAWVEITLRELVVRPLCLPAEVVSGAPPGEARVRFMWIGETVADHIEKLVFRRHRRKIAGARQHRA